VERNSVAAICLVLDIKAPKMFAVSAGRRGSGSCAVSIVSLSLPLVGAPREPAQLGISVVLAVILDQPRGGRNVSGCCGPTVANNFARASTSMGSPSAALSRAIRSQPKLARLRAARQLSAPANAAFHIHGKAQLGFRCGREPRRSSTSPSN